MVETIEKLDVARARKAAARICDPEVPVLTIEDLGVLRDVRDTGEGRIEVIVTPTYSGCPAMSTIELDLIVALERAGFDNPKITHTLSPAWTTDWMSDEGREKLRAFGIAPPKKGGKRRGLFGVEDVECPQCGSSDTTQISEFGSTSCKALWRCKACAEPFDYFKCH